MKKVLLLAIVATCFGMTSCKKDYTCECTIGGQTLSEKITNSKKSDAKTACDTYSKNIIQSGGTCSLK
jgi:hypothetical protein